MFLSSYCYVLMFLRINTHLPFSESIKLWLVERNATFQSYIDESRLATTFQLMQIVYYSFLYMSRVCYLLN